MRDSALHGAEDGDVCGGTAEDVDGEGAEVCAAGNGEKRWAEESDLSMGRVNGTSSY